MTDVAKVPGRPFEFESHYRQPDGALGELVETIWFARGTIPYAREKIAPTGSSVAVVVLGDPIVETPDNGAGTPIVAERGFIIGPHVRPVVNEPTGETFAVGIVARPIGCAAVFGAAPSTLRGRVLDLDTVWLAAGGLRARLLELAAAGAESAELVSATEQVLNDVSDLSLDGLDLVAEAVRRVEEHPTVPIAELADSLGISHGHLDREFRRVVGITPRALARLLRLQRMLAELDVGSPVRWTDVAADLGWFDQAHFVRDFKRHTGVTPSEYLEAQRDNYAGAEVGEGAGFVPEA